MNRPTQGAEGTAASPLPRERPARRPAHRPSDQPTDRPPYRLADQQGSDRARISYVYAVGRAGTALEASAPRLTGLRDGPLRTVTAGRLTALVSSVPADSFSAEGMKAQLEDLTQLETIARTHHAVVEAAWAGTMVLPMRLATVYLDDARVRAMLDERSAEFDALLSRLEGHAEVGVKVYADARAAAAAAAAGAPAPPDSSAPAASAVSPGRAYLQQRRAQQRTHRDAYRAAGAVAADVRVRVADMARDMVAHRPQQGELASAAGENIANEAYLVPTDRIGEFHRALKGLADGVPGVRVEITGPWAPYSFATPPAESANP
ncbi:GvpL/GvpF family gas vesicle protein [Streptomyces sp. DSM 41527]|uniref:GvpL/GvpF family gas vesicle protein n=1 Tax=Streptomyces mooreae TaxID=3075523 RepID=A0ABU2T3G8_9ACTN|nr:GvpL/GvpF family gas vesicle protein [Streptomyces sp. DSM 41527]MDT0454820.1 GvpL/GvpF family gas vesicle protein [Streptomyces sp. DSM 41527]